MTKKSEARGAVRKARNQERFERAQKGQPLFRSYTAPGLQPEGSPAWAVISGVVLAAIVGGLMWLGELSGTAIAIAVVACLAVGLYLGNEQRWLNEETERRKAVVEDPGERTLTDLSRAQLSAMLDGQLLVEAKRRSQGRQDEADEAARFAVELKDELELRRS